MGRHIGAGPQHGEIRTQRDLDAHHEAHRVEPVDQPLTPAGLGPGPEGLAVVDPMKDMLDVAGGREDQVGDRAARLQSLDELAGDRVQPAQPVGPAHREHLAVGQQEPARTRLHPALLQIRIVDMGDQSGVRAVLQQNRRHHALASRAHI
jgi:hypothetical protein